MTTSERSTLETELRARLTAITSRNARASERFAEANGLILSDLKALVHLRDAESNGREELTPGDLTRLLDLSSGAVTYLVERLSRAGLVKSERDPLDRRRTRLRTTPEGAQVIAKLDHGLRGVETLALTSASDEELAATSKVLQLLEGALDSYVERFAD